MDFAQLKKNKDDVRKKLQERIEGLNSKANFADDRFWSLKRDKADNGSAVIRFLMAPEGEDFPFIRYFTHQFKGTAGWLFENCLTSLSGRACPVS